MQSLRYTFKASTDLSIKVVALQVPTTSNFLLCRLSVHMEYFRLHHLVPLPEFKEFSLFGKFSLSKYSFHSFILLITPMVGRPRAITKSTANRGTTIPIPLESGQNTPPVPIEMDLNTLNNEQIVQYIKRLQATLDQYKAREEASQEIVRISEKAFQGTPWTRGEASHQVARLENANSKEKENVENEEFSNEALRSVDWKLVHAFQRFQKEQKDDFEFGDALPLFDEILVKMFPNKFKLPSLDKYDRITYMRSHLTIFRTTMQL